MTVIIDFHKEPLAFGDRVAVLGFNHEDDAYPEWHGVIEALGEPDGDIDGYGRIYGIAPRVTVRFDSGEQEQFTPDWTATGPWDADDAPYQCSDLEKVKLDADL